MFIATLIAPPGTLTEGEVSSAADRIASVGCSPTGWCWIDRGTAADLAFGTAPAAARSVLEDVIGPVDVVVQPARSRAKAVLVADMDSTMITVECIDELADYANLKPEIAAITEAAMRGELDFASALSARVRLLAGLDEALIERCLAERVELMAGASSLIGTMRARGAYTVLVSGGFTRFADPIAAKLGFHRVIANRLEIAGGRLTGEVAAPIVGAAAKEEALVAAARAAGVELDTCLAVGDGANDLGMIARAGLGIAFHAKPIVAAAADARIVFNDLTALLHAQGIARAEWVN